ncbi:hypothetical protein [Capnocytophaga catalasegens]|nr:hypothetical protein [Capnocytophaga catalasegens]
MMCFCLSAFAQRTALTYESTKLEDAALLIQEKNTSLKNSR